MSVLRRKRGDRRENPSSSHHHIIVIIIVNSNQRPPSLFIDRCCIHSFLPSLRTDRKQTEKIPVICELTPSFVADQYPSTHESGIPYTIYHIPYSHEFTNRLPRPKGDNRTPEKRPGKRRPIYDCSPKIPSLSYPILSYPHFYVWP